jgi:hypothetical protein
LDHSNYFVIGYLKYWIKTLVVGKYAFDGIKIGSIQHVPKDFLKEFIAASGTFSMGECFSGNSAIVGNYQKS